MEIRNKEKDFKTFLLLLDFLREEIPSVLQVITLMAFLLLLDNSTTFRVIISAAISLLLSQYLVRKAELFWMRQITDNFSELNIYERRNNIKVPFNDIVKRWNIYLLLVSVVIAAIVGLLSGRLHLQ